jgi:hypothetical protein
VEILRLLTEELGGINSTAVYAHKGKYYLYGRKVLRIIPSWKQIDSNKKAFEMSYHFEKMKLSYAVSIGGRS